MPRRSAAEARTHIQDAAIKAFLARGYQDTTLEGIATSIGMTRGAILYHFDTKDDLLRSLIEPVLDDIEQQVQAADVPEVPTREDHRRQMEAIVATAVRYRPQIALITRFNTSESPVLNIGARLDQITASVIALLVGRQAAQDPQANVRAAAAWAMVVGGVSARCGPADPDAERETLVNAALAALYSHR